MTVGKTLFVAPRNFYKSVMLLGLMLELDCPKTDTIYISIAFVRLDNTASRLK